MNLRLKLRKNQSTIPTEKLTKDLHSLELLGEGVVKIPDLDHLEHCQYLMIICPELKELPKLPKNVEILKIRGGRFALKEDQLTSLEKCRILNLMATEYLNEKVALPPNIETLDLSSNKLESFPLSITKLTRLGRLTIDSNKITTLPNELFSMKNLNHLSLDNNPLSEETKQKLHEAFGLWF